MFSIIKRMGIKSKVCNIKTKKISESRASILIKAINMNELFLLLEDRLNQNKVQTYGIFKKWSNTDDTKKLK